MVNEVPILARDNLVLICLIDFLEEIGYRHNFEREIKIAVPPDGYIELDPKYRTRFSHICSNDLFG